MEMVEKGVFYHSRNLYGKLFPNLNKNFQKDTFNEDIPTQDMQAFTWQ